MKARYIIALLVALFLLALLVDRNTGMFNTDRVRWMAALNWAVTALGIAIATISAFRLLHLGLQGATLPQIMPPAVAFFAGLTLFQTFWAVPLSFAAVLICWLFASHFRPPQSGPKE